jgi:serine/threonine protein kinase
MPLTSTNAEHVTAIKLARDNALKAAFPNESDLSMAKEISEIRTEDELSHLPRTPDYRTCQVIRENDLLGGAITLEKLLSSDGMTSQVWLGKTRHTESDIVIKYLVRNGIVDNLQRIALALQELQRISKIRHPNVVNVIEAGRLKDPETGQVFPFVLMEYIDGCTLADWEKTPGRADSTFIERQRNAVKAVAVLSATIHYLHTPARGKPIWHLDLKPSNVMVKGGESEVVLSEHNLIIIDFGSFGGSSSDFQLLTPEYMAPERHGAPLESASAQWDVYSLGGILYYLIKGGHPVRSDHPEFDNWYNGIELGDKDLNLICKKALAPDHKLRYRSAKEFEEDLLAWIDHRPLTHARTRDTYNWWETESLLWIRARKGAYLSDHSQIVARAMFIVGLVVLSIPAIYFVKLGDGNDPSAAFGTANAVASTICFFTLLAFGFAAKLKLESLKVLEPIAAFVASIFCVETVLARNADMATLWSEYVHDGPFVYLFLTVIIITIGNSSSDWRFMRPLGWTMMLFAFALPMLFRSSFGYIAFPLVFALSEFVLCMAFATPLFSPSPPIKPNQFRLEVQTDSSL